MFPTCSNGLTDMFENVPWDFDAYTQDCYKAFQVVPRAEWPVIYYGGQKLEAYSNIVFSNGGIISLSENYLYLIIMFILF